MIYNNIAPLKRLGQHYLINQNVLDDIVSLVPAENFNFIEIGPGTGNLTRPLLELVKSLTCVEIDSRFARVPGVRWVNKDALSYDFGPNDYVVGNLPYNISVPLLLKLARQRVAGWVVMVQKEVGERIVAKKGKDYGSLSLLIQSQFDVKLEFLVHPTNFTPPPKVYSAVLSARLIESKCDLSRLEDFAFQFFRNRRKQLRNVLPEKILSTLDGVDLSKRAEDIPPEVIYELASRL